MTDFKKYESCNKKRELQMNDKYIVTQPRPM